MTIPPRNPIPQVRILKTAISQAEKRTEALVDTPAFQAKEQALKNKADHRHPAAIRSRIRAAWATFIASLVTVSGISIGELIVLNNPHILRPEKAAFSATEEEMAQYHKASTNASGQVTFGTLVVLGAGGLSFLTVLTMIALFGNANSQTAPLSDLFGLRSLRRKLKAQSAEWAKFQAEAEAFRAQALTLDKTALSLPDQQLLAQVNQHIQQRAEGIASRLKAIHSQNPGGIREYLNDLFQDEAHLPTPEKLTELFEYMAVLKLKATVRQVTPIDIATSTLALIAVFAETGSFHHLVEDGPDDIHFQQKLQSDLMQQADVQEDQIRLAFPRWREALQLKQELEEEMQKARGLLLIQNLTEQPNTLLLLHIEELQAEEQKLNAELAQYPEPVQQSEQNSKLRVSQGKTGLEDLAGEPLTHNASQQKNKLRSSP